MLSAAEVGGQALMTAPVRLARIGPESAVVNVLQTVWAETVLKTCRDPIHLPLRNAHLGAPAAVSHTTEGLPAGLARLPFRSGHGSLPR